MEFHLDQGLGTDCESTAIWTSLIRRQDSIPIIHTRARVKFVNFAGSVDTIKMQTSPDNRNKSLSLLDIPILSKI